MQRARIRANAVNQFLVRGGVVGATGIGGVVSVSGCRGPRMEILGSGERLADNARTDGLSVAIADLAIRFVFEQDLRYRGDHERINHTQQDRGSDGHKKCSDEMFLHKNPQARCTAVISMSMSLMPTKGAINPPTP